MRISDIKIGNRFRKDLGEIQSLVNSIKEIGLLQPIVVNENKELIAGQRRIEACKRLEWTEIPTYIVNLQDVIEGEFQENEVRKDFTYTERVAILEEIERRRIGHKLAKGKGVKLTPFQEENKGKKSRDIAAEYLEISPLTLYKTKKIVQAAREDKQFECLVQDVDTGKVSVDRAYTKVKQQQKIERIKRIEKPKTDLEICEKLGVSIRPDDVWNFPKQDQRFGLEYPGQVSADIVFNTLYFFTEQGDLVIDPMATDS